MDAFLAPPPFLSSTKWKNRSNVCCTSPKASLTTPRSIESLAYELRKQLPSLFSPSSPASHYNLYDPSVTFEDPLNKFTGIERYKNNISFLNNSPVFMDATLTLYDTAIIDDTTIRTRWALSMTANLPWKPCVSFTGQSDYIIRKDNSLVIRHIDIWDSLRRNEFFSFEAVIDLIRQCAPGTVSPSLLGGFELLRRTATMQIRRFSSPNGLSLSQTSSTQKSLEKWVVDVDNDDTVQEQANVSLVAVSKLPGPPTVSQLAAAKEQLKREVGDMDYLKAGERSFYVVFNVGSVLVHEVWQQLESAQVQVE